MYVCLMLCCVDKLCVSETPTYTQTVNSCGCHADVSEDEHMQSDASIDTNSCSSRTHSACTLDGVRCCQRDCTSLHSDWRPLLLVIPMRLGLTDVNPIYFDAVKVRVFCHWQKPAVIELCQWFVDFQQMLIFIMLLCWVSYSWLTGRCFRCLDIFYNTPIYWYHRWQTKQCLLVHRLHRLISYFLYSFIDITHKPSVLWVTGRLFLKKFVSRGTFLWRA